MPALATGAVSAVGSLGVDKIFGKGQTGGFLIPQNKIDQLIKHKGWLTEGQKKQILSALQSGGQLVIRPTAKQRGGFLGSLLASIGIPLALEMGSKLFGKGLSVPKKAGEGLMMGPKPGWVPYHPPPLYGSWEGSGKKKAVEFCWAQTVHSTVSLSWGQFCEETNLERCDLTRKRTLTLKR